MKHSLWCSGDLFGFHNVGPQFEVSLIFVRNGIMNLKFWVAPLNTRFENKWSVANRFKLNSSGAKATLVSFLLSGLD